MPNDAWPRLRKGTRIGRTDCPACGAPVTIVTDKNGKGYGCCYAFIDPGDDTPGGECLTRVQIGTPVSARLAQSTLRTRKQGGTSDARDTRDTRDDRAEAAAQRGPDDPGDAAGTGDGTGDGWADLYD